MKNYEVVRRHLGDRWYEVGEMRSGDGLEHLVPRALRPIAGEKADHAPLNKAESAAPVNKAETGRKATTGRKAK